MCTRTRLQLGLDEFSTHDSVLGVIVGLNELLGDAIFICETTAYTVQGLGYARLPDLLADQRPAKVLQQDLWSHATTTL